MIGILTPAAPCCAGGAWLGFGLGWGTEVFVGLGPSIIFAAACGSSFLGLVEFESDDMVSAACRFVERLVVEWRVWSEGEKARARDRVDWLW